LSAVAASQRRTRCALTIAGSDSGGGAGIQADLKAFARCGVHGLCAITAITAQNTRAVTAVHPVPPDVILAQVRAVAQDIGIDAVKVGMLGSVATALAVARALDELPACTPVVVDPVMVAESGARLLDENAQRVLAAEILPRATVATPNVPEARVLAGEARVLAGEARVLAGKARTSDGEPGATAAVTPGDDPEALARAVFALGPAAVVVTGGHRPQTTDLFFDGEVLVPIPGARHPGGATHGSGCTHSSVLAAQLALGRAPLNAARIARALAGEAVGQGLRDVGDGPGPVDVLGLERMRG
jgi:hydroxymethylpyrimidine/phosphomethylpyrimidine kinase